MMSTALSTISSSFRAPPPPTASDKKQANLDNLVQAYSRAVNEGQTNAELDSLGSQITENAKILGQGIALAKPVEVRADPAASNPSRLDLKV